MPRIWIECEHHTGAGEITSNHLHDDDRKRSIERIHVTINLVGDCTLCEQTRDTTLPVKYHAFSTVYIEEGFVLASERGFCRILDSC